MKKLLSVIIALVFTAGAFCLPAGALAAEQATPSDIVYSDIGPSIDSFIAEREKGLASCAVSVFDRGGVIYEGCYGYADIGASLKADRDTVYEWGSCSKMLVWVSVMQLCEQGRLDLDADIREYLPEGFLTKLQYPEEKLTMTDLMNHKGGFQESYYENQQAAPDDVYDSLEDAVRACECYQAYHVGQYTAYSNWSTALAAYIVERVSGTDYVTYINENIFRPLGMEHTCIDPRLADNEWVNNKRSSLKCYSITRDSSEDYGECRYAIQLFPAGSAVGTLEDFTKFGLALVADECPLVSDSSTRDEMFTATSFYGDSDIAKNCHGLWTNEYKVQTMGHGGNTGGCTSNLVFDPVSGLGVAVMTNEQGETAFCYGIPALIFGDVSDREEYKDADTSGLPDISGVYYGKRSIASGAAKGLTCLGAMLPLSRNDNGTYSFRLAGIDLMPGSVMLPVAENCYVFRENGMDMFLYYDNGRLEMETNDFVKNTFGPLPTAACILFVIFGIVCLVTLLVKLAALAVRKLRKRAKKYRAADRQILVQQIIYGVSGVIFAMYAFAPIPFSRVSTVVSAILAAVLGIASVANGAVLCYNTVKADAKTGAKAKHIIWSCLGLLYATFIIVFQLYNFWTL